jgi:chromosome segregation ATPase
MAHASQQGIDKLLADRLTLKGQLDASKQDTERLRVEKKTLEDKVGALDDLRAKHKASSELADTRGSEIEKLKKQIDNICASNIKSNDDLIAKHASAIDSLHKKHKATSREHGASVKSLQDEIIALSQSKTDEAVAARASLDAAESTIATQEAQNRTLEAQLQSVQGDLQDARFQADSLKQILISVENESKEKEKEQAVAMEKLNEDMSGTVKHMADMSARLRESEIRYQSDVEKLGEKHMMELKEMEEEYTNRVHMVEGRCQELLGEVERLKIELAAAGSKNGDLKVDGSSRSASGKSKIVDGQIAEIQEGLKQLDEMNREFLEEHENMARVLSKVEAE